jgi:hypothetical protein
MLIKTKSQETRVLNWLTLNTLVKWPVEQEKPNEYKPLAGFIERGNTAYFLVFSSRFNHIDDCCQATATVVRESDFLSKVKRNMPRR